jgi:broad specificity phosphatase PhoE
MKITFYYVRHGQTLFNVIERMQGECDSPLTEAGIEGARDTASALRKVHFAGCYSSFSERNIGYCGYSLRTASGTETCANEGIERV